MSKFFDLLRHAEEERESRPVRSGGFVAGSGNHGAPDDKGSLPEEVALVQRVFMVCREDVPHVVAFSGAEGGDPSSSVCARAGEILAAQKTGTVCLVDANPYTRLLGQHFGADGEPGFVDAIFQGTSLSGLAREMPPGNLWLLGSGSGAFRGPVILTFDRIKSCLSELRAQFDYVLIDAPPVNAYADVLSIGQLADGVILVLRLNSTRRESALSAKANLLASRVRLLGAVLTDRTFPIPDRIYRRL